MKNLVTLVISFCKQNHMVKAFDFSTCLNMESVLNNPAFEHILEKIFLALDSESLQNCELVSKSFAASFENPKFWFKKCNQKNLIENCFKVWNRVFKITEDNEAKISALTRVLKKLFMDQNDLKTTLMARRKTHYNPMTISILLQEFELAEYIVEKWDIPENRRINVLTFMFDILLMYGNDKAILAFTRKYDDPKVNVKIVKLLRRSCFNCDIL